MLDGKWCALTNAVSVNDDASMEDIARGERVKVLQMTPGAVNA
jgi:Cu/Ag efflux protein CusF